MSAGADTPSRTKSFVCQSTPHSGSTSREVPTLFEAIIHDISQNVNSKIQKSLQPLHFPCHFERPLSVVEGGVEKSVNILKENGFLHSPAARSK